MKKLMMIVLASALCGCFWNDAGTPPQESAESAAVVDHANTPEAKREVAQKLHMGTQHVTRDLRRMRQPE